MTALVGLVVAASDQSKWDRTVREAEMLAWLIGTYWHLVPGQG